MNMVMTCLTVLCCSTEKCPMNFKNVNTVGASKVFCTVSNVHCVVLLVLLPQAPESLLESLETHLNTLEGKKP